MSQILWNDKEINDRGQQALVIQWFWESNHSWNVPQRNKEVMWLLKYKAYYLPILLRYETETWEIKANNKSRLEACETKF